MLDRHRIFRRSSAQIFRRRTRPGQVTRGGAANWKQATGLSAHAGTQRDYGVAAGTPAGLSTGGGAASSGFFESWKSFGMSNSAALIESFLMDMMVVATWLSPTEMTVLRGNPAKSV